jgi:putative transcriptional regulator
VSSEEPSAESLAGQLLIAAPNLLDPNFFRTVVLLLEHQDEGAVGVVLNRPSEQPAHEAIPDLADVLDATEMLHQGGPVQPEAVIALGEYRTPPASEPIVGRVGLLGGDLDLNELGTLIDRARIFLGYAGWGPGQLEAEIAEEAWILEPAQPADVFSTDPTTLWREVLDRKGGRYRLLARMPDDPSLN